MSWLKCWLVLFASCLFARANGHIRHSQAIQKLAFSREPCQLASTNLTEGWCLTQYKIKTYSYLWTVANFSLCPEETGEYLTSSTFPQGNSDDLKWIMQLYPMGQDEESKDHVSVRFKLLESKLASGNEVRARFRASVIDQNGQKLKDSDSIRPGKFVAGGQSWVFPRFILRDELRSLLQEDKLTVHCVIDAVLKPMEYSGQLDQLTAPTNELANHLEQLYESKQLSDLMITTNDKEFKAHKAILAARSPVFKAMFGCDMKEAQFNRLELADIHPDALEELLRFIYTGKSSLEKELPDADDQRQQQEMLAVGLLKASDKYQLDGLKAICELALGRFICVDSAAILLSLADQNNAAQLKSRVIKFICSNYGEIVKSNSWTVLVEQSPQLLPGVYDALGKYVSGIEAITKRLEPQA